MHPIRRHIALLIILAALGLACAPAQAPLRLPPQELAPLLPRAGQGGCLLRPQYQQERAAEYLARYFACWARSTPKHSRDELLSLAQAVMEKPGLGINLRPRPQGWYGKLWREAGGDAYPDADWKGLTLRPCNLRVLPTLEPDFEAGPGGGFPFDRLQQTSLPGGLPVRVWHVSPGGDWLVAETPLALGWLPTRAVGRLTPQQATRWMNGPFVAVTKDQTPVRSLGGGFVFNAALGWLLPLEPGQSGAWRVRAPLGSVQGEAVLGPCALPLDAAAPFPLPLTPANLGAVARPLLGQPYDWGGQWGRRDCSALTRDLLAPFGLWLPRNSSDQAKAGARNIPLEGLGEAEKRALILKRGLPWLSLLYLPGHVMLYLGAPDGQPLVLQALWGLKTRGPQGEGRRLVGRVVISGLNPGAELPDLARPEGLLLPRLTTLVVLAPPHGLCPQTE
ncbi:MAG: SH3 domain-containing protein [Desulfarculaceae bacterium]|nr:SH3 domain-containing protein [Desulfarculaceae bacterium]MCF8048501.1 SH3 domain-containing protein [Desulfarculaceae bacterium]MCF8097541.1 SH3 domain-containing protein [Desulfarculaceae bacterium]MCF8122212.1 SH3 domain-containing protein [Desulfarculaceae bacterium]